MSVQHLLLDVSIDVLIILEVLNAPAILDMDWIMTNEVVLVCTNAQCYVIYLTVLCRLYL